MRYITFVMLLVLASCSGCKKEEALDAFENRSIIGTWYSSTNNLQYAITHIDGIGKATDQIKFKEYKDGSGKSMLSVSSKTENKVYIIKWLGIQELFLIDSADKDQKDIPFTRIN